jgi:hypothetical protein
VATKKKTNEGVPFNECPSCRGPIVHESMLNEKQDACYHKVKSRYKVWPSAYASGALVQCRKKGASNWGTGGKKSESSIMKGIVDEASGTPGGLERYRTPAMVNATMQQSLYKRELAPIKAAEKKRKEAEYRKNNPSVSVPSIQIGASTYPIHVIHNWIGSKDLNAAVEFAVNKFAYRQSKDFKTEIAGDPDFQKAVKNFFNVAEKSLNHRDSTRTKSHWDGKVRAAPRETDTSSDGFDAINKINDALLPYYKKYGVDKTGRRVPPNFNYALGEAKAKQYVKPYNDPQTGEQIGWVSSDGYHKKYWQKFAKDSAIKHAKLNPDEVDEAVDPKLGYDPNDYDDDYEEPPLQTATHVTIDDISMQRGGDLPAGTELKQHKRSKEPGPDQRARFWFFVVLDNGYPTRLVRLPKKLVKSVTMHEDYTGEFAAEKTPAINPYGGLKDNQFRGAISEEPTTSGPIGTQPGGWRKYKPKPAGEIEEDTSYAGGMGQGGNAGESYRKFKPKSAGTFNEDLSQADVDGIARFADKLYKKLGIDITFTKHFMDRVNDERNGKPISGAELVRLFKKEYERWGKDVAQMGPDMEGTFKDLTTDINLPFVLRWDRDEEELDLVAKTVMRKKNFKTDNQEFPVDESEEQLDEKCWDSHKQVGMKTKGGKSVPNCVPKESAIMKGIKNRLI